MVDEMSITEYRRLRDDFFDNKSMIFASEREQFPDLIPIYGLAGFVDDRFVNDVEMVNKKRKLERM
jgi:hypothetical protein